MVCLWVSAFPEHKNLKPLYIFLFRSLMNERRSSYGDMHMAGTDILFTTGFHS